MVCKQAVRFSFASVRIVCICPDAPHGTYGRRGHNNNHVFVFPAWNMVIARLGLDGRKSSGGFPIPSTTYNELFKRVGAAIRDPAVEGDRRLGWVHPLFLRNSQNQ